MLLDQIRCVQAISSPISFLSTRRLFIDALHCIYATYVIVSCFSDLDTPIVRHCCGNQVFRIYFELIDIIAHVNWTGSLRYRLIFQSITATAFGCTGKEKCQDLPLLTMGPAAFLTFCDYHLHNIAIFTAWPTAMTSCTTAIWNYATALLHCLFLKLSSWLRHIYFFY